MICDVGEVTERLENEQTSGDNEQIIKRFIFTTIFSTTYREMELRIFPRDGTEVNLSLYSV